MAITKEKMNYLDKMACEFYGIKSIVLMENAAMGVFNKIKNYNSFTIICGCGNNGGDGVALARHLFINNKDVDLYIIGQNESKDFSENLNIFKKLSNKIYRITSKEDIKRLIDSLEINEVTIDAIFGIGLNKNIEGIYKDVIDEINKHSNYTISLDIPSGIDADSGNILGICVIADETYTMHDIKLGLIDNKFAGKINNIYIGIPCK